MKKLFIFAAAAIVSLAPCAARSGSSAMAPAMIGMGPHGYDFLIGTWHCKNAMPSPMGGPPALTASIGRSASGSLAIRVSGTNFDGLGYVVYAPQTKTWWNPSVLGNGDYSTESTQQTGMKTIWTGPFFDVGTRKTILIRDTYTIVSTTTYKDLSEAQLNGSWKIQGNTTCTKS